jgi:tRNA1Val (adenine37-N6)-methyltransferase
MIFKFKKFSVEQSQSAMKVGTDGVLLGAWTPLHNQPYNILDIGTGTGLIALQLAQRSTAEQIDALEIDDLAFEEAVTNFENSPWGDRLFCFHAGLDEFVAEPEETYDCIVCNPPFYTDQNKSGDSQRDTARQEDALPFDELVAAVSVLLSDEGIFSVIIPYKEEEKFIQLAKNSGLFPFKITRVQGNATAEIKRSLLAFTRNQPENITTNQLTIEISRHQYTPEYQLLTQDFYLNK